jgi:hypothetical protein
MICGASVRRKAIQRCLKLAAGRSILIPAEPDRVLPDLLDGVEYGLPALLAYCVAEDAPEQADIATQRQIFVSRFDRLVRHRLSFWVCPVNRYAAAAGSSPSGWWDEPEIQVPALKLQSLLRGACPRAARSADPWARNDIAKWLLLRGAMRAIST